MKTDTRRILGAGTEGKRDVKGGEEKEREESERGPLSPAACSSSSPADELPRPSLVALPGPVVAPGDNVSLRCTGRLRDMRFALYRVGEAVPLQYHNSERPWADFPLPRASAPGTYSCYYHTPNVPYVLSQRSEPLVISWDGEGPPPSSTSSLRSGSQGSPLPSTHLNFEGIGSPTRPEVRDQEGGTKTSGGVTDLFYPC